MPKISLRVLITKEEGRWLAQCLEFDIAVQAVELSGVEYELQRLLVGYLYAYQEKGLDAFERLKPPPSEITAQWDKARTIEFNVPSFFVEKDKVVPITVEAKVA